LEDESAAIARVDPRARLAGALAFATLVVFLERWEALAAAGVVALALAVAAKAFKTTTFKRHAELNVLALFLVLLVPLSTPGEPLFSLGPMTWSREGADFALGIAAKANIVMLACGALIATMDPTTLARAAKSLGTPGKLVQIMFFCVRYLDTAHHEFHKLRNAMRARGFRAGCDAHSLRSIGYFMGMLFIRALDRSERVLDAMKCRGFQGRLHSLTVFKMSSRDAVFAVFLGIAAVAVAFVEWGRAWIT
jgi:cobalt/nickel transport system permease protein